MHGSRGAGVGVWVRLQVQVTMADLYRGEPVTVSLDDFNASRTPAGGVGVQGLQGLHGLFLVWGCLGFVGDSDGKFRGKLRKVCERCGVCGQKTGLTIRIQNGSRDFRNREKVFERQKTGKRFQAENQGFRGVSGFGSGLS